ncbi:MAG: heme-binding protein [Betaproteobacteria bacterium]|nr:heme-binding protein [Betaproteobacteria bacterium]
MKTKHSLTLDDCKLITSAAEACALQNNWPVCIAVVDDGGHLLMFQRLDGCAPASIGIAQGKAHTAALRRRPTRQDEEMVNGGRASALSLAGLTFLEGGIPIVYAGDVIGAVGVSGVKSIEDAEVAQAGITALLESLKQQSSSV